MSKKCPKCGKDNLDSAKFCEKCGNDIETLSTTNVKSNSLIDPIKNWWNERGRNGKIGTSVVACCIGLFLLIMVVGSLAPESTALSVTANVQIDENTSEYIINGTTEPNAKVYINSSNLNLTNVEVPVDNKTGNFQYKLNIPIETTDLNVEIKAKSPEKIEVTKSIVIQRPSTPLTINPIATLKNDTKTVTIEGTTDPNAEVNITSSNLNVSEVINADSEGKFSYSVNVPTEISSASFLVKAKSVGKRSVESTVNIVRESPPPPAAVNTNSSTSNSDSSSSSTPSSATGTFVGSINSDVYHYPSCASAKRIHSENLITFSSVADAQSSGYRPCKQCSPPG